MKDTGEDSMSFYYFLFPFLWHESAFKYFHFLDMLFQEYHVRFL
jgi:hypothetical protein